MKKLSIDIMTMGGAKFYRSLQYSFNPMFLFDIQEVYAWIMERCPLLKYEKKIVLFIDFPPELRLKEKSIKLPFGKDFKIQFIAYARCNDKKRCGEMPCKKRRFHSMQTLGTV